MNEHDAGSHDRHDRHDERLRELLDQTAPDRPDVAPAARVTAVADRARAVRRRQGIAVAAAVLAVVGAGIAVPLALSGDDDPAQPDVAQDPPAAVTTPPECPAEPIDVTNGLAAKDLPDGAVSARLCPGAFDTMPGTTQFALPTEPVTDGVDDVLAELRALPAFTLPQECASIMVAPMPWALVVSYPDGAERTLGTTMTTCAGVTIAGQERAAESVLEIVTAAAADTGTDTGTGTGTDTGTVAACPGPGAESGTLAPEPDTWTGDLADLDVTSAAVCYGVSPLAEQRYAETRGFLEGAPLGSVVDDVVARTTPRATLAGRCTQPDPRLLVLAGDEGQVTLTDATCSGEFSYAGGFWVPDEASERSLTDALGGSTGG